MPSFVMAAPCPNLHHRDLEDVGCKTDSNLGRKISIQWRPRHSFVNGPEYDPIRPRFFAPLTVRRPLTVTIVLASDAVAEWFGCGHITQRSDPQICR
jgi:hypothetical protein